ncbi:MAG: hypothetical protein ACR2JV_05805 [Gaiellales bacterium]
MAALVQQWDAILADESADWENAFVELRVADNGDLEEAALILCSLNPWHGESWRSGWLRFRVARTFGYGADDEHARAMLAKVDARGIGGELELLRSIDRFQPVHTQGTV